MIAYTYNSEDYGFDGAEWSSDNNDATFSVKRTTERDEYGKTGWTIAITHDNEPVDCGADKVWTHAVSEDRMAAIEALECAASFLSAWMEALRYPNSDNRDIFPMACEPFADEHGDNVYIDTSNELSMARWAKASHEWLIEDGDKDVPCSRYGRKSSDVAWWAIAIAIITCENSGGWPESEFDTLDTDVLDGAMSVVVNDGDSAVETVREYAYNLPSYVFDCLDDDLLTTRIALSGRQSEDEQVRDVVNELSAEQRAAFDAEFPDWLTVDPEVEVEFIGWVIDWIEANTDITWEDGEPFRITPVKR